MTAFDGHLHLTAKINYLKRDAKHESMSWASEGDKRSATTQQGSVSKYLAGSREETDNLGT